MMWEHLDLQTDYFVRRKTFPGWEIKPRTIDNYEIVLIISGYARINVEDRAYLAGPGDLFCFCPGVVHSLRSDREPCMEFWGVHFSLPEGMDRIPLPERLHPDSALVMDQMFQRLQEARRQCDVYARWRQNLLTEQILCQIYTELQQEHNPVNTLRIQRVLDAIQENPVRDFSLEQMLELAGIRKTLFLDQFRRVTGTTPGRYVEGLRMELARELLTQTELSVAEIARRCGYEDGFYFSRCFKKHCGMSPSRYRSGDFT